MRLIVWLVLHVVFGRRQTGGFLSKPTNALCEDELGENVGRYPREIAAAFPPGIVIFDPQIRGRNLFCNCDESPYQRMICVISVRPGTDEAKIIMKKLELYPHFGIHEPVGVHFTLSPFFVMYEAPNSNFAPDLLFPYIVYSHPDCVPQLLAEIHVTTSRSQLLTRALSAPSRLKYPWRSMSLVQCLHDSSEESVCPIMLTPFLANQVVYILKEDITKALQGKHVQCISSEGLRQYSQSSPRSRFRDPLRREDNRMLTIKEHYEAFLLIDDPNVKCTMQSSGDPQASEGAESHEDSGSNSPNQTPLTSLSNLETRHFNFGILILLTCLLLFRTYFHKVQQDDDHFYIGFEHSSDI